jgi:DNA-binding NtrC family response regulator
MKNHLKNPLSEENKFDKLKESCDDVLITGPSGAGKGYLAKRLHTESNARADKNFIHVNCASINSNIFESEMFGHIKGSFTGAFQDREGYCRRVMDGDLFLDEIGDLSLGLQAKLLVLISDRIYMAVGSCEAQNFYGRIIAATNKCLKKEVSEGRFREDLYYRLSNFVLNVETLYERKDKIPELVKSFIKEENAKTIFDSSALQYLSEQKWNGNIRQLKSVVKRIVRYNGDDKKTITKKDAIPYVEEEDFLIRENGETLGNNELPVLIKILFEKINGNLYALIKLFLEYALRLNGQNVTAAARTVCVGRKTLERMLKKYNISRNGS